MSKYLLYRSIRFIIAPLFKVVFRPIIIGSKKIPKKGRMILVGNHTNNLDSVLLLSSSKRTIRFLAKKELIDGSFGFLFKNLAIIPVDRKNKNPEALKEALKALSNEEVIGIFPESTINRTKDVIMPFKIGAVKMAHETDTLILPFIISGKYGIFKNRARIEFLDSYKLKLDDLEKENKYLENIISEGIIKNR